MVLDRSAGGQRELAIHHEGRLRVEAEFARNSKFPAIRHPRRSSPRSGLVMVLPLPLLVLVVVVVEEEGKEEEGEGEVAVVALALAGRIKRVHCDGRKRRKRPMVLRWW